MKSEINFSNQNGNINKEEKKKKRKVNEKNGQIINNNVENMEIPTKKRKTKQKDESKNILMDKESENGEKEINSSAHDIDNESVKSSDEEEPSSKLSAQEVNELTAKYLRSSFNSASGISILRKFVQICHENKERDLASEYIEKSGNVLEILRLLESGDKKNLNNATLVFSAMHIVIMKILSKYPQNIPSAQQACHHFINSHLSIVHTMMSNQSNAKQRKIILRLLASIVALGDTLPRELLAHLSFHQETLALLSMQTKPTDPQNVRTCFIHFILAFLVDSRISVIKVLLEKRGLLASIFPDLIYDSHVTVSLVLNTIKKYVLENTGISKTTKLHVFSTPVVQNLVSLYNWKGPRCWSGFKHKKQKTFTESVNFEEKQITIQAVHEFLLVLLTSNRYGIIFNDKTLGTTGKKHNQLVNSVLQSLERPWDHEKPCDLVSKILAACPDLIKPQLLYTESFLEPRPSKKWIAVMDFVRRILRSVDPEVSFKSSLSELTTSQLVNATLTLALPSIVLKKVIVPCVNAPSTVLRYQALETLKIMLEQVKKFLETIKKNVISSEFINLQSNVRNYINKNIPSVLEILKAWNQINEVVETEENNLEEIELTPQKSDYFSIILDLLQVYHHVHPDCINPQVLEKVENNCECLITSLNNLENINQEKLNFMRIKAIQMIQIIDSSAFTPEKKFLGKILTFLISLLNNSSEELKFKGKITIKILLQDSKIFEGCEDQMDIWLNTFYLLQDDEERLQVAQWFVKLIPKAVKRAQKYQEFLKEIEKTEEKKNLDKKQVINISSTPDDMNKLMQPTTSIPPILCAAFDNLKKNSNEAAEKFISFITIFTLHCQVTPTTLIELNLDFNKQIKKYVNSWKQGESPISLKILSMNVIGKISKILLSDEDIHLQDIFNDKNSINSSYDILNILRMTIFYLSQFIKRDEFTEKLFDRYKNIIILLLNYSKNFEENEENTNFSLSCSKCILTHPIFLEYFSPIPKGKNEKETIVTTGLIEIFLKITEINGKFNLENLFFSYKNKLYSQLIIIIKKCSGSWKLRKSQCLIEFLEILQFNSTDLQELLKGIANLPKETFIADDKKSLSILGEITPKIMELLSERKTLEIVKESTNELQIYHKLCIHFSNLKSISIINVEKWEIALYKFFKMFPHNIAAVDPKTFNSLLNSEMSKSSVQLISFFTERCVKLIPFFIKYICTEKLVNENRDLIFSVLSSNLSYKWPQEFLKLIYKNYKEDIINYFTSFNDDNNWINSNLKAVTHLINSCFTLKTCEKISNKILSSGDKLETVDLNYIILLKILFMKLSKLKENEEEILTQFLQILIRLSVSALKKNAKEEEKVLIICKYFSEIIKILKSKDQNFTFEKLNKIYCWPQFTRYSLKLGLKISKDEKKFLPILRTLSEVCDIAYKEKNNDEYIKTLFEMTTSHSEFMNIMLSSQEIKRDLLQFILILVQKNSTVMMSSHIPLYLSAYNATLSQSDQQILLILHHYETSGIKLNDYRPYLFGEAAAAHYSVRGEADTAIWRQPSTSQVLDLFNIDNVINTIKNFPVNRKSRSKEFYPDQTVYDPAFYLPLLTHLLTNNNVIACHQITQSGALALIFAACGSTCQEIRMTAFTGIARFYFHLEATSSKEKLLWMRIIDALRNGIASLECPLVEVRLSCLMSTFLAMSSLVSTQPLNPLYSPVQKFFMAKPELELKIIPEFLTLFNSSDINHKIHRHWILQIIRDGVKTDLDMEIALKCFLFRDLFYFYGCILADPNTKICILQIIEATVKISKAALFLCYNNGLLVWLEEIAKKVSFRDTESIELIVNIVRNLLDIVLRSNDQDNHIQFMLLNILKMLILKLSKNISVNCHFKLLSSIKEILQNKSLCETIHKNEIQHLIEISKNIFDDVNDCTEILIHSCEFVMREEPPESIEQITVSKYNLTNIVITWKSQVKS